MKTYSVMVWYRYVSNGEQEKEFEIHEVKAISPKSAIKKAVNEYKGLRQLPFSSQIIIK